MNHPYRIRYSVEPGQFSEADTDTEKFGLTDAIVIASIIRGEQPFEGQKSIATVSMDGYTGKDIPDRELFQVFSSMASILMESPNVTEWMKEIARKAFNDTREKILEGREES
jgi:hypothetical protein